MQIYSSYCCFIRGSVSEWFSFGYSLECSLMGDANADHETLSHCCALCWLPRVKFCVQCFLCIYCNLLAVLNVVGLKCDPPGLCEVLLYLWCLIAVSTPCSMKSIRFFVSYVCACVNIFFLTLDMNWLEIWWQPFTILKPISSGFFF